MSLYAQTRRTVHRILDADTTDTALERAGNIALNLLILANVLAVILGTVQSIEDRYAEFLAEFEAVSLAAFTVEYALRLWTCTLKPEYASPIMGRIRYALSPMALIDLGSFVGVYLPFHTPDFRYMRIIRLVRVLRVLKLARYSRALRSFGFVMRQKKEELALITLFLLVLLVVASSTMYFIENEAQPGAFASIPAAMWWGVATLTTVGYGDIYPITPLGKFLGAIIALLGIGFFALPAGVLSAAFAEELQRHRGAATPKTCPHCGREIG